MPIPRQQAWPGTTNFRANLVADLYDKDTLVLAQNTSNVLGREIRLCTAGMPCSISVMGSGVGTLFRIGKGTITCLVGDGCQGVEIGNVLRLECHDDIPVQPLISIDGANLTLFNASILHCKSESDGGAIRAYGGASVSISASTFQHCSSDGSGGAISCVGGILNISDTAFVECSSKGAGGAIYASKLLRYPSEETVLDAIIVDSSFRSCWAQVSGGAISVSAGQMIISKTSFRACHTISSGGAVYADQGSSLMMTDLEFTSNWAIGIGGGAIHIKQSFSVLVGLDCKYNQALAGGGGVVLWEENAPYLLCSPGAYDTYFASRIAPSGPDCSLCPAGTYSSMLGLMSQGNCPDCGRGSYSSAAGSSLCGLCETGKFSVSVRGTSVSVCGDCSPGTFQSGIGQSSCFACLPGFYSMSFGATACQMCPAGTVSTALGALSQNACVELCSEGMYSAAGSSSCSMCPEGAFLSSNGTTSSERCLICAAGKFTDHAGGTLCQTCMPGYFSFLGASSCDLCIPGTISSNHGSAFCQTCNSGKFSSAMGQTLCSICSQASWSKFSPNTTYISCSSAGYSELCPIYNRSVCFSEVDCTHGTILRYVPNGTYNSNEVVEWIIGSEGATSISLRFTQFSTEPGYDIVSVYSCTDLACENLTLLQACSGLTLPDVLISTTGIMKIVWTSDTCCPKRSGCYCDNPIFTFILSGWVAMFAIAGPTSCPLNTSNTNLIKKRSMLHDEASFKTRTMMLPFKFNQIKNANQERQNSNIHFVKFINDSTSLPISPSSQTKNRFEELKHSLSVRPCVELESKIREYAAVAGEEFGGGQAQQSSRNLEARKVNTSDSFSDLFCGLNNSAVYGPCIASAYASLKILGLPTYLKPSYPSLSFSILIQKQDFYGQLITTDSQSILQVHTSFNKSVTPNLLLPVSGSTIGVMIAGQLSLNIALKPIFGVVDARKKVTSFISQPAIYLKGVDTQTSGMSTMLSEVYEVLMANGSSVCPQGFVLLLDLARVGSCMECGSGTYSVDPLVGRSTTGPSCLNCPQGGVCKGGSDVQFYTGQWDIISGMYRLVGCPSGHQLVNSIGGVFSHDIQDCLACSSSSYIGNPNNSNYTCQNCPIGAVCDGNSLTGLVTGSVWSLDASTGIYILISCPMGYEKLAQSQGAQQCQLCQPLYYCPGSAVSSSKLQCPQNTFSYPGTNASQFCMPAAFVDLEITLPLPVIDFDSKRQQAFIRAIALAGEINPLRIIMSSITAASRRSSMIKIQIQIAAADPNQAHSIASDFSESVLDEKLALNGLPNCKITRMKLREDTTVIFSSLNSYGVAGIAIGTTVLILVSAVFVWFQYQKSETNEEKVLQKQVKLIRDKLLLQKAHGFYLSSERAPLLQRREQTVFILKTELEAAARLALFQDFDLKSFDALCHRIEYSMFLGQRLNKIYPTVADSSSQSPQYAALCEWLLEIGTALIEPLILCKKRQDLARLAVADKKSQDLEQEVWDETNESNFAARDRFLYLVRIVSKARIWQEHDQHLWYRLKQAAADLMQEIEPICDTRFRQLCRESGGEELLAFGDDLICCPPLTLQRKASITSDRQSSPKCLPQYIFIMVKIFNFKTKKTSDGGHTKLKPIRYSDPA